MFGKIRTEEKCSQGTKHSGASQAINAGVALKVIQERLGHKDPRTTARCMEGRTERLKSYWDSPYHPQTIPGAKNKKPSYWK